MSRPASYLGPERMFGHTASVSESSVGSSSSCGSHHLANSSPHHHKGSGEEPLDAKKRAKREANRRSAQLSRARKKQFIEELKQKNHEYQRCEQILACHPDMVFAFDATGTIEFANARACSHLDLSASEIEAQSFFEMLAADSRLRFQSALQQVMSRPGQMRASLRFDSPLEMTTKHGETLRLDVLAQCTREENEAGQWLVVCAARPERFDSDQYVKEKDGWLKGGDAKPQATIDAEKPLNVFALVAAAADLEPLETAPAPGPRVGALAAAAAQAQHASKKRNRDGFTDAPRPARSRTAAGTVTAAGTLSSLSMAAMRADAMPARL